MHLSHLQLIVVVVGSLLLIGGGLAIFLRHRRAAETSEESYTAGLNYLLAGDQVKALEAFRRSVARNTANVDAYIRIGDILRQKGQPARAIKVHRELTVRDSLTREQQLAIYRSLAEDYRAGGEYAKAAGVLARILTLQRNDLWALHALVEVYEALEDWGKAAEWRKKLQSVQGVEQSYILALYKIEQGRRNIADGDEKEGRIRFREAMKLDAGCAPAYLELADSYLHENREKEALRALRDFAKKSPKQAYLAFSRIRDVLFRIGQFSEVEHILEELIQQHPQAVRARLALADVYERRGAAKDAVRLCEEALGIDPDSLQARAQLIRLYEKQGQMEEAVQLAEALSEAAASEESEFECSQCGYRSKELFWRCPRCGAWQPAFERW